MIETASFINPLRSSCYVVGFGIGVPMTMSFALFFRDNILFSKCSKATISIKKCIHIDSHLTSILHTSLNLFRSVPESQSEQALACFEKHLNGHSFPLPAVCGKLNCILNYF
jgi:hypothetical protein